jgi:hypothetical protein
MKAMGLVITALGLVVVLGAACGGDGSQQPLAASDELKARIFEAARPSGKVLHIKGRVGEPDWIGENPHTFEFWLDGDSDRFRWESRRQWEEGSAVQVTVGAGWERTTYESDANLVNRDSIPAEYQAKFRDPAALALGYLWALATADEWQVLEEKTENGRSIVVIEARGVDAPDINPDTVPVSVIELDKDTLWPVRETDRNVLPSGEVDESALYLFDTVELLSAEAVPDDLFSREAVESLYMSMEDKLDEARAEGFTLYWLGERYAPNGSEPLVLRDVGVRQGDPRWVSFTYSPEEVWAQTLLIREGTGTWSPNAAGGPRGHTTSDVAVRGATGVLYASSVAPGLTAHSLVLTLDSTTIELWTVPAEKDGQDVNAHNSPEALIALAEDLAPVPDEP